MEPQETADPQEALAEVWRWLSAAGPHFPGGWGLDTDLEKGVHRAYLAMKGLPDNMHNAVRDVIRQTALSVGWRAKHIAISKDRVSFALKPYPLEMRLREEARSEEFRQEARRRRSGTPLDRAKSHIPEP